MKATKKQLNDIRREAEICLNFFHKPEVFIRESPQNESSFRFPDEIVISFPREKAQHANLGDAQSLLTLKNKIEIILKTKIGALWFGLRDEKFEFWAVID